MRDQQKLKRSDLVNIIKHARALRSLLENWPAREIMTDYEKEWNAQRERLLSENPFVKIQNISQGHGENK